MPDQRFAQRDTWKRMVGITLAYAGLNFWATGVGATSNQPLAVTCIYVSRSDEQNDIGPTSFVNVVPTKLPTKSQRWSNEPLLSGIMFGSANVSHNMIFSVYTTNNTHLLRP